MNISKTAINYLVESENHSRMNVPERDIFLEDLVVISARFQCDGAAIVIIEAESPIDAEAVASGLGNVVSRSGSDVGRVVARIDPILNVRREIQTVGVV